MHLPATGGTISERQELSLKKLPITNNHWGVGGQLVLIAPSLWSQYLSFLVRKLLTSKTK